MTREFDAAGPLEVVEEKVGTGSTDFWAISFSPSTTEQDPMGEADLERGITLLRAAWAFFDSVAARVSPEMAKGPRGGGRDRDHIIRHTIRVESLDFASRVGLIVEDDGAAITPAGRREYRKAYVAAMRSYNAGEVEGRMRSWTLPFVIRHSAFHTLDHAWEMEDKDLSAQDGGPDPTLLSRPCPDHLARGLTSRRALRPSPIRSALVPTIGMLRAAHVGRNMSATEPCSAPSSSASGVSGHTPLLLTKIALSVSTMPSA